jgi:hypothetical protein
MVLPSTQPQPWKISNEKYMPWHKIMQVVAVDFEEKVQQLLINLDIEGISFAINMTSRMNVDIKCNSGSLTFPVFTQAFRKKCLFFILLSQPLNTAKPVVNELTTYTTYAPEQWKDTIPLHYKSNVEDLIATCVFLHNQVVTQRVYDDRIAFFCNGKWIKISIHTKNNTISCCVAVSIKYQ